jgi:ribosomal protein S12 methylthiotransferase
MEKFHIVRLGCPKNDADMDILRGILENKGYKYEENAENSDMIIIDTCGFIENSKKESIDTIFEYNSLKENNPALKIIPIGCMIERYYDEFREELNEADGLFGVITPQMIVDKIENNEFFYKHSFPIDTYKCEYRYIPETPYAYVKISDGCSRKCAFCSIPYFKGDPKSREIEDIKKEVEFLIKNGKKEIILVSQDNTLYGADLYGKQSLPKLLNELNKIDGDFWIRVMYLHPDFINDEIIDAIHNNDKILNYFDIPMQTGSNKMLKAMGRIKMRENLLEIVKKVKKVPSILRTSIIVGFPGETDEDFKELLDFVDKVEFDKLGAFIYSPEEGTPSYNFKNKVDEETKAERLDELMSLQKDISNINLKKFENQIIKCILEEENDGVYIARSWMDAPEIDGNVFFKSKKDLLKGSLIKIKINETFDYDMEGELVD